MNKPHWKQDLEVNHQMSPFVQDLADLINRYCMENDSNTPDYILAVYVSGCLQAYASAVAERDAWYSSKNKPPTNTRWCPYCQQIKDPHETVCLSCDGQTSEIDK